jgi:hypothetical protein
MPYGLNRPVAAAVKALHDTYRASVQRRGVGGFQVEDRASAEEIDRLILVEDYEKARREYLQ